MEATDCLIKIIFTNMKGWRDILKLFFSSLFLCLAYDGLLGPLQFSTVEKKEYIQKVLD